MILHGDLVAFFLFCGHGWEGLSDVILFIFVPVFLGLCHIYLGTLNYIIGRCWRQRFNLTFAGRKAYSLGFDILAFVYSS